MKKALICKRDGALVREVESGWVDSLEKLEFYPGVFGALSRLERLFSFELVMLNSQDRSGTAANGDGSYRLVQQKVLQAFKNEGIEFRVIDTERPPSSAESSNLAPELALLQRYLNDSCDLKHSFLVGSNSADIHLASILGVQAIMLSEDSHPEAALCSPDWLDLVRFLALRERGAKIRRTTNETDIEITLLLDGQGLTDISTGLSFFDHMLEQLGKHSGCDLRVQVKGDLHIDEHHTVEDTALALGSAFRQALGDKRGIERYGFCLPMDDAQAQVSIDFSGRPWLVWNAEFKREKVGDLPTELFSHFFKSFSDAAACNLNVTVTGENEHHKIEATFKALARAIRLAIRKSLSDDSLPSTKGVL